jgi:amino acid transporter
LVAIACAFAGLCYAEMASTVPIAASAYTYPYATMGEFIAWIIGWDLILEYALGATTVAIGWSGYVVSFLRQVSILIPDAYASSPFAYDAAAGLWSHTGAVLNIPAMFIIVAISALLVIGIRESSGVNNVIVMIKVAIVVAFIVAGIAFVSTQNWVTAGNPEGAFIPPNQGPGIFGWSGVLRGAAVVFFAYSSTRSRPHRRRPSTRSAISQSASSGRLVFALSGFGVILSRDATNFWELSLEFQLDKECWIFAKRGVEQILPNELGEFFRTLYDLHCYPPPAARRHAGMSELGR